MNGEIVAPSLEFPEKLFRYRSLSNHYAWEEVRRAVNFNQVYLTSANTVNDPFDFRPHYSESKLIEVNRDLKQTHRHKRVFSRKRYGEILGRTVSRAEYLHSVQKSGVEAAKAEIFAAGRLVNNLPRNAKLACFSENGLCMPMWAHYSGNHSGICIEYSVDISKATSEDESVPLPVNYVLERPSINTLDLRGFTNRSSSYRSNESHQLTVHDILFLSKARDWEYEREWRVFEWDDRPARYKEVKTLKVSAIYFGLRATAENKEKAKTHFGTQVSLFELQPSRTEFTFEASPI
jgi:hypothetical protein